MPAYEDDKLINAPTHSIIRTAKGVADKSKKGDFAIKKTLAYERDFLENQYGKYDISKSLRTLYVGYEHPPGAINPPGQETHL